MMQKIAIVGAGLLGAALAFQLVRRGAEVTVLDGNLPGQAASGRSFGWLNASFYADEPHFRLRMAGMEAWRRLKSDLPELALRWPGALWWEEQGEALQQKRQDLTALGYPVAQLSRTDLQQRMPDMANLPETALLFTAEGAAETGVVVDQLLRAAQARGARVLAGLPVTALLHEAGRIAGVQTASGRIAADQVLVAAGTGAPALLQPLGLKLPMLSRPGVLLRSRPLPKILDQIIVTPKLELRQDPSGRLLFPTSPNHQGDAVERLPDLMPLIFDAERRLQALLPQVRPEWEQSMLSQRPVPQDGLPAVGPLGPKGLYVSVMHCGATLAAIIAESVAAELFDEQQAPMLKPYRPARFQS